MHERTTSTPAYRAAYPFIRLALGAAARSLAPRLMVSGQRHVPRRGGVLITPNHISDADPPFVVVGSPRPMWFMAKAELFEMGILGPIIKFWQTFPVEQGGADRAALRHSEALLKAGQALVVFPEGRCSPTGEIGEVLPGAVQLALRAGVPVVPVGLWGVNEVVPFGSIIPRPTLAPVRVHFGPAIRFDDLAHLPRREVRDVAAQRLEEAMRAALVMAKRS